MTKAFLICALMVGCAGAAQAQAALTLDGCSTNAPWCSVQALPNPVYWQTECIEGACRAVPVYRSTAGQNLTGPGQGETTYTTAHTVSCPRDRTLVMLDATTMKCAKDLTDPQ